MTGTRWVNVLPFWPTKETSARGTLAQRFRLLDQVALFAAEEGQPEVADRDVGNGGDDPFSGGPPLDRGGHRFGDHGDLASEDEGEVGQFAETTDGVGGAGKGLFEEWGSRSETVPIAWRPAQCSAAGSFGADVAEVALVDLEGLGQGYGYRFDVGVAGMGRRG